MSKIFQPEHPPVIADGQCPPQDSTCPPFPHHISHHVNCPTPPPMPEFIPGHNPCIPHINPVPPVPSPIEGSSLYESMGILTQRVNTCIEQWNNISANCYEALNKIVAAAQSNDVYYDGCEVKYQSGYDEIEGSPYAIIEKKAVDKKGNPIRVELYPAFGNTSNPGVSQKIFDASFVKSANVIITAVQAGLTTWGGPAMIHGNEIPGTPMENGYLYGFTKRGALRFFPFDTNITTLCQQGMVDVIGGCVPLVYDGKVLDDIADSNTRKACTAIGFNSGTGSVFFFSCGDQTEPGITLNGVARILTQYGCTIAVCTSATINETSVQTTEGMLYLGQMTTEPAQGIQPNNIAYWVVTKQHCFRNKFEKEIADLVQTTGRNAWQTYLLGIQIQSFDDRISANSKAITDEIKRAMQAEEWLQQNINSEVNRALQAEEWLQININNEVNRATNAEQELDDKIVAETDRATAAELKIRNDLNTEIIRATNRERQLQTSIDEETSNRIQADLDIIKSLEQETAARKAEDDALRKLIQAYIDQTDDSLNGLEEKVNGIIGGQIELPYLKLTGGKLSGPVTMTNGSTITVGRGPTDALEVATKQYVDDAIGGGTTPGGDVSKEYVDQQVSNLQQQLDGKVSKTGDSMSGALNMQNNELQNPVLSSNVPITVNNGTTGPGMITNLRNPTNELDATNKQYVDQEINGAIDNVEESLSGKFLKISGGNMTGDINMTGDSVVSFYDDIPQTQEIMPLSGEIDGMKEIGSIYNDDTSIVVKSEEGSVKLIGSEVVLSDGEGNPIAINGTSKIQLTPGDDTGTAILLRNTGIDINSSTVNIGNKNGLLNTGSINLYDANGNVISSIASHNQHLDINVSNSAGSLYVNRQGTAGGTGEIWATEFHSPNELRLNPGTNVNVLSHKITGVSNAVNDNDAVNMKQLKQYTGTFSTKPGQIIMNSSNSVTIIDNAGIEVTTTQIYFYIGSIDITSRLRLNSLIMQNGGLSFTYTAKTLITEGNTAILRIYAPNHKFSPISAPGFAVGLSADVQSQTVIFTATADYLDFSFHISDISYQVNVPESGVVPMYNRAARIIFTS